MSAGPNKLDRKWLVHAATGMSVVRLQLTAEEGFVLSRVDRPMSVETLIASCGLAGTRAEQVILNLIGKGALLREGDVDPNLSRPPPSVTRPPPSPYGDFIFSPAELNDAASIPIELRKEIVFLHAHLTKWSHWRLLGVRPDATADEIRKGFLDRSKRFHPDNFFRQDLGRFGPKLAAIFQRLKLASDVLSTPEGRQKYEREARELFSPEERTIITSAEVRRIEDEQRRDEQRKRLLKGRGFAKFTSARDELTRGDELLGTGDIKGAMEAYNRALELDPRLDGVKARIAEAHKIAKSRRSDLGVSEAQKAIDAGELDKARTLLKSAIEAEQGNERAHALIAYLILRTAGDPNEARLHAQKAVDLGDPSKETKFLLARALKAMGKGKDARKVVEPLAKAGDAAAQALLKEL